MYETRFDTEAFEFSSNEDEWAPESLEEELATELMTISTEEELDQFLGKLAGNFIKGAAKFVKSPIGKAIGGVLKGVAKTALPIAGGALGSLVAPGIGTVIGRQLGSLAGGLIKEEEAQTMSEDELQQEAARRYVRFARDAYRYAARAPYGTPPRAVARSAAITSARRNAPGLLRNDHRLDSGGPQRRRSAPQHRPWRFRAAPWPPPWAAPYPVYTQAPPDWIGVDEPGPWWDGDDEAARPSAGPPDRGPGTRPAAEGRWVRRGRRIVLQGV